MSEALDARDAANRARALDVTQSFLVQAPAGSGKTELLIQRFLALLACVDRPERVVAMTFTRKAAAEMRNRIIDALVDAEIEMPDADSLTLATRALARQVRERDRALGWNLVAHPAQLRIYTIDAFCASLARQAPVTTRFGAPPRIDDETLRLYEEAVRAALIAADPADAHWRTVLDHVDNDTTNAVQLLVDLLAKRDQWLKHLVGRDETTLRSAAEATLVAEIESELVRARSLFPVDLLPELALLLSYAARNLASMPERLEWCRRIEDCVACGGLPDAKAGAIAHWQTLAECLLTQKGGWRSKFEVGDGFPPKGSGPGAAERDAFKARMTTLVDTCASVLGLREALAVVRRLPPATFDDASWRVVASMQALLPRLAAQLKVTFAEAGVIDPTEAMLTAIDVLGTPDAPSDLLLRLDLSIAHLLIDEFQDTSDAQGALFERLTAGWIPGDGRTVFAVGDPMQSIYRFREAEVRLFLEARERLRIGNVPLTFIDLTRNFRSQARIVSWVNDTFPRVFAERDDPWRSAVAYARSVAARPAIAIEPTFDLYADSEMEAAAVIARVQESLAESESRIAILVRARSHLVSILPALYRTGIPFAAVDLESLSQRQAILDLLSLTHALAQPADRLAWLALLRAPWCGVDLRDLFTLAAAADTTDWCEAVTSPTIRARLTESGAARMTRFAAVIEPALLSRGRASLVSRVRGAWLTLGGPACVAETLDLDAAERFLALLAEHETGGDLDDYEAFRARLEVLMAAPTNPGEARVSVMTLHKAKGLQFDTVILPGLDRAPAPNDESLLRWRMRPGGLLLAPRRARGAGDNPIYRYLADLAEDEEDAELARLLYVGCTRAKTRLHLTATLRSTRARSGEIVWPTPSKRTALAKLWPVLLPKLPQPVDVDTLAAAATTAPPLLARLPLDYRLPEPRPGIPANSLAVAYERVSREFDWAEATAAAIGTVAHRLLAEIGRNGLAQSERQTVGRARIERELVNEGLDRESLAAAVDVVQEVLDRVRDDARGRWLFDPTHDDARSELAIAGDDGGAIIHVTIDRTFVANRVRWIVDFKTGRHEGGDVAHFLDTEFERYAAQLERYARIMRGIDPSAPIRLALYYPLVEGGWREWTAAC
jgi:ATP-dependent exoDNAse (exonuclease V) beta subunit